MHVSIKYCGEWNYYPRAASLANEIQKKFTDVEVELIEGSGGVFEVVKDGKLI